MAPVNWCEKDQTTLAREQVMPDGTCERCGTAVYQRDLEQWFFRINGLRGGAVGPLQDRLA